MNASRAGARRRWPLLALPLVLGLAACSPSDPQNSLSGLGGDVSEKLAWLFWLTMAAATIVFVIVQGVLLYTVIRYRRRPNHPMPHPTHGHTVFEVGWTIVPTLILVLIGIPSVQTLFELEDPPSTPLEVEVIGHQWWWEFRYPAYNVTTATELHMPINQPVRVSLRSADVQHSFWLPKLAGKTDLIPPRVNHMWFNATQPGTYEGQCGEFCGIQHAQMRLKAVAHPPAEFDAWVRAQQATPAAPTAGAAQRGSELLIGGGCIACHTIEGTVARGQIGPNLTHVASRTTLAGGILPNTPENLARWLRNPQEVKVGNQMILPRPLSEQEVADLVAYLGTLR